MPDLPRDDGRALNLTDEQLLAMAKDPTKKMTVPELLAFAKQVPEKLPPGEIGNSVDIQFVRNCFKALEEQIQIILDANNGRKTDEARRLLDIKFLYSQESARLRNDYVEIKEDRNTSGS